MKQRLIMILCLMAGISGIALTANPTQAAAPAKPATSSNQKPDLLTKAAQAGNLKMLLEALDIADLQETLTKGGPYTIFAPSDVAFAKLPKDELQRLMHDKMLLRRLLLHHVVSGEFNGDTVRKSEFFESLSDEKIQIGTLGGEFYLDKMARLVQTDLTARNGVIHVIDRILLPTYQFK